MPLTLNGTGSSSGTSILASNAISINAGTGVLVRPGDLVVALMVEQTALTASGVTDNLGNTYTAQNAGTLSTNSGRMFYSRVTVGGTLTTVTIAATSSANDFSCCAAVFSNGFDAPPIDANPANGTGDITSPFTCPATGALAQARELVVCWSANNGNNVLAATSPLLMAVQVGQVNTHAAIGYKDVSVTTTTSSDFTGTNPTVQVLGTASFKQTVPLGQAAL